MKILIADDDAQLIKAMRITLAAHGHDVTAALDGAQAIELAATERPEVVLLDLGMPRFDGLAVIAALRAWTDVPIIVVSGRAGAAPVVAALDAGADDYVRKPFQIEELLARLRAATRRSGTRLIEPTVAFGDVRVDLATTTVTRGGEAVHLTPTEWRMLELLARNPGALVTRQTFMKDVWDSEKTIDTGYLRLYISQLRKKLEANPAEPVHLLTEQGMGYRLVL